MKKEVSNSELAKELEASPASITSLKQKGVIKTLPNGRIDRRAALRAIASNTSGAGGGWEGESGHGKPSLRERAEKLLSLPKRRGHRAAGNTHDKRLPPDFAAGMAFLSERLRDPERIDVLTTLAVEAVGVSVDQGRNMAKLFAYMAGGWISDYLPMVRKRFARRFQNDLEEWATQNLTFKEQEGKQDG